MSTLCQIYRSPKTEGMYLYVKKSEGLERVPEELLQRFGKPEPAMVLALAPERKLARVSAAAVLEKLEDSGYFLQLPPLPDGMAEQQAVQAHNSKL